jgi:hypothetical protein
VEGKIVREMEEKRKRFLSDNGEWCSVVGFLVGEDNCNYNRDNSRERVLLVVVFFSLT